MHPERRVAFITGITGQDGSYLAEFLLAKGYDVHGMIRRSSSFNTARIDHIINHPTHNKNLHLHYGDLLDATCLSMLLIKIRPTEVYNLAAQSHVMVSFDMAEYTGQVDALGTLRLLEAIKASGLLKSVRFYQASTSELYGKVMEIPQKETTPFYPRSPYGAAKLYSFWIVKNYREAYGLYACNGILFNHESPRRGRTFVTRKITHGIAQIVNNHAQKLILGNLDAKRDWGHARDYVEGMWLMLQQPVPQDFVLATGETHSVREFTEKAFAEVGITIIWEGTKELEVGRAKELENRIIIQVSPKYYRPTEVDVLLGDPSKAKKILGWTPKTSFDELIKEMVQADLKLVQNPPSHFKQFE